LRKGGGVDRKGRLEEGPKITLRCGVVEEVCNFQRTIVEGIGLGGGKANCRAVH